MQRTKLSKAVKRILWEGQDCYEKTCPAKAYRRAKLVFIYGLSRLVGLSTKASPVFCPDQGEVQRLSYLGDAGYRVPKILSASANRFIVPNLGPNLEQSLYNSSHEEILSTMMACTRDLLHWHQQGQWHGSGQIRNLILAPDGQIWRIDFEEILDQILPLNTIRVYDLILFLSSMLIVLPIRQPRLTVMKSCLQTYVQECSDPEFHKNLERVASVILFCDSLLARYPFTLGSDAIRIQDLAYCLKN